MAKIKLTKSAVDAAQPQAQAIELRDTPVPGFLCKITPAGRKMLTLQYRTNAGERRKPALGQYGELTVEQARSLAQEWLAEVRLGGDPSAAKAAARAAATVKEFCEKFMEEYSAQRHKPSTRRGYALPVARVCRCSLQPLPIRTLVSRRVTSADFGQRERFTLLGEPNASAGHASRCR